MDQNGNLCTSAASSGAQTGSVTPPGTSGTQAQAIQGINNGVPVAVTSSPSAGSREQDVRASQTLNAATLNAAVTLQLNGQGSVGFTFTGLTASGATLTYEQSNDGGTTWTGVNEVNAGTGIPAATRTADGQTRVSVSGRTGLRVRVSTVGTGTITVATNISVREAIVTLGSPLPPGTNLIGGINNPFALEATQQSVLAQVTSNTTNTGNVSTSNAAISAATGTSADPASISGANTTIVGALRAIRDRLLALSTSINAGQAANGAAVNGTPVRVSGSDGTTTRDLRTTTTGVLEPPTAASGKIVETAVSVPASTSTQLVAANANRIGVEIQCDGAAPVGIGRTGAALTSATTAGLVIPSGSFPLYTPPIASLTAITAYTATAQSCRVTEYIR
jgi:hypothetical protein